MKKVITIVCDKEVPVKELLNDRRWEIYVAMGDEDIITMVEKEKTTK